MFVLPHLTRLHPGPRTADATKRSRRILDDHQGLPLAVLKPFASIADLLPYSSRRPEILGLLEPRAGRPETCRQEPAARLAKRPTTRDARCHRRLCRDARPHQTAEAALCANRRSPLTARCPGGAVAARTRSFWLAVTSRRWRVVRPPWPDAHPACATARFAATAGAIEESARGEFGGGCEDDL